MKSSFVSQEIFDEIITEYVTNLPKCKQGKVLINLELLNKVKHILLNPTDTNISDKNTQKWARKRFRIEEITPVEELFFKNIRNEEDIPNTIEIQSIDCTEAMNDFDDIVDQENYENKIVNYMSKGKKQPVSYEIRDLVRISIPKIDRFGVDRPSLSCKIIEKPMADKYRLGSKFGIIDVCFSVGELDPLNTSEFPELDIIPSTNISVREALRLQDAEATSSSICNCKGECNNNRCYCKKNDNVTDAKRK
ncbi:2387_t:CDS:2 [Cetraspora pellucida]|uniref:2387_t:CDS:1 n=1 Tax=Cetraspora pellucida TaxID=1433469 RepID=A0ACA9MVX7_9GLOM|nr:2387_t:CDS:2 [Cetraspora pellucida]